MAKTQRGCRARKRDINRGIRVINTQGTGLNDNYRTVSAMLPLWALALHGLILRILIVAMAASMGHGRMVHIAHIHLVTLGHGERLTRHQNLGGGQCY